MAVSDIGPLSARNEESNLDFKGNAVMFVMKCIDLNVYKNKSTEYSLCEVANNRDD